MDHGTPVEEVGYVWNACQRKQRDHVQFGTAAKQKIRRELKLQKLQHLAELPGLEQFQAVDRHQLPKEYHTFQAFLNQSATEEISKSKEILVDWNQPIKLKMVFLPDTLM